ncbi:carboxypeptidase B-like [Lucilia sericata]|uniref:carboxypeptidase B-like n=1 Tax=Lucilia sericata TaxID=13632 RepID=UPI0018A867CA|nr:carboxypeptidase B-like [Lucilia sericata]
MNRTITVIGLLKFLIIFNILTFTNGQNNYQKYEGYKIYEIHFHNENQNIQFIKNFPQITQPLTTNRPKRDTSMRVLMSPREELKVLKYLQKKNIHFEIINYNVAESIRNERKATNYSASANTISFESYQRFDVISNYMEYLKMQYPERIKLMSVGKSYEGRDLKAILITNNKKLELETAERPLILIDAGIHAREWIAPATALFVMQQLVENNTFYERELTMYDWLIWPVVNPDGYEYTHETDRLWRKNRRPSNSSKCLGADLNRNFDFNWAYSGVSKNACSEIYCGDEAFSEPESRALKDLLNNINATCRMYLTLHSYGNYLLYPWGYEKSLPSTWPYLDAVARAGARAIKKASGTVYAVGGAANVLYPAAGGSDDYAFALAKIPVVICMELPSGGNNFDPPSDKIQAIVEESWLGIRAMALEASEYPLRNVANCNIFRMFIMLCVVVVLEV